MRLASRGRRPASAALGTFSDKGEYSLAPGAARPPSAGVYAPTGSAVRPLKRLGVESAGPTGRPEQNGGPTRMAVGTVSIDGRLAESGDPVTRPTRHVWRRFSTRASTA